MFVGHRLKDGTYLHGLLSFFSTQIAEHDERSLQLERPVRIRTSLAKEDDLVVVEADTVISVRERDQDHLGPPCTEERRGEQAQQLFGRFRQLVSMRPRFLTSSALNARCDPGSCYRIRRRERPGGESSALRRLTYLWTASKPPTGSKLDADRRRDSIPLLAFSAKLVTTQGASE